MIKTLVIIVLALLAIWIGCKIVFEYVLPILTIIILLIVSSIISIISKIFSTAKLLKIQEKLKNKIQASHFI